MQRLVKILMINIFTLAMLVAMLPVKSVEAAETKAPLVSIDFAQGAGDVALTGAEIVNDSIRGNVLKLNGSGSRTSYGTYTTDVFQNNDWTNGMTLSAWVQTTEGSNVHGTTPIYCVDIANRGYIATLCSLETTTNTNGNEAGFVEPLLWNDPSNAGEGVNKTGEGRWQLITVVYDTVANNMNIYVDGECYATNTINNGDIATLMEQVKIAKSITLGSWNCEWWKYGDYKGLIDDFNLWNSALSADDIKALYQTTKADEQGMFEMTPGGSIRVAEPYGLRFQVRMDADVKTYVEENSGKVGMFIFPADYLADNYTEGDVYYENVEELVKNAPNSHRINLDLTQKLYEKDGLWYGNGAIVNIKEKNMAREFVGIAYYEVNGVLTLANTQKVKASTRSAAQVALLTHADKTNEFSDGTKQLLVQYIDYLNLSGVEDSAPSRYKVRGYAADDGLHIYAVQYVNQYVIGNGDNPWNDGTHLEAQIWQHNMGHGVANGLNVDTYCAFFLNGKYSLNDSTNTTVQYNYEITDRGDNYEEDYQYRYEICYDIFLQFPNNLENPANGPYAFVQFRHHMPGESQAGFDSAYKERRDGSRYLYRDNCSSYEFRGAGIVDKKVDYLPTTASYNKELLYQNQGTVQAADPCVITVGDTFYLYATDASEGYDCTSIRVWSSKNLTDWIEVGQAFRPASDAWAVKDLWAPEVIAANGKYYMYYSGLNHKTEVMGIGVAVSESPTGPFHEIEGTFGGKTYSRTEQPINLGFSAIDPNPFIDDDGSVYLYVSQDQVNNVSSIYGCKLSSDMVTVESVTTEALVAPNVTSDTTKYWNEAPYMYKHDGKYYLAFSSGYYGSKSYCLGMATSNEPLSGFSRVDYNPLFKVDENWTHVSGTGHCSFFPSPDGTELWVAYHSHIDTENGGYQRKINFDKVTFDTEGRMVISGPSITPQVVPSGVSDYGNIALKATVTATAGENLSLLTDDIVNYRTANIDRYEYSSTGENTIIFAFKDTYAIKGIMVYDSADTTAGGQTVTVTIGSSSYELTLDSSTIPGTASILELDDVTEASEVTLTFTSDVNLSEIVILANKKPTVLTGFPEIADFTTINADLQSVDSDLYNFQMWTTDSGFYAYFVQTVSEVTLDKDDEHNWENTHVEMELWNHCVGWGAETGDGTYVALFPDESIYINNETNEKSKSLHVEINQLISGETKIEYYFYLEFDNNLANPQDGPYAYVKQYQFLPGVSTSGLNSQVVERGRQLLTGDENSFQVHATIDAKMYN